MPQRCQRRPRRRSPSTSPERAESRASPPRIVTEPVFVPEPDEVREVVSPVTSHADSEEDLQAVLRAVAEEEADQKNQGDGAPRDGAENDDPDAAASRSSDAPLSESMQINLDNVPAASAPHAAPAAAPLERAPEGASSLLSGLSLEQRCHGRAVQNCYSLRCIRIETLNRRNVHWECLAGSL